MNADVIVLGLQSKDQAEQWLRVSAALGARPAGAPMLLLWLRWETVSYLSPVLVCSGSLPHCKPVYKYTTSFSCPGIASPCSAREATKGPPRPAAVAGGMSGVGAQHG